VSSAIDASLPTVAEALREAALRIDRSEARILLGHVLAIPRSDFIVRSDRRLQEGEHDRFGALVARRTAGEPIAYLVGEREFYGLTFRVTPDVLIPRPETEHLVEHALERLGVEEARTVLELGTGSGAIAVSLAFARPKVRVLATDVSAAALAVASDNARRHGVALELLRSDWFSELGARRFDLIAANPPYVAASDPHLREGDVRFEPPLALVGGEDGMDCIRRIVAGARTHLARDGWLLLEHGYDQGRACLALLREAGYDDVSNFPDLAGQPRVCAGRWRG
jgi:release factor glutamine methyltransferase